MSKKIIVGVHKETKAITPISKVNKVGLRCNCICHECKGDLEAVINTRRRKHFRHSNLKNCNIQPETELHLLAKKIILDNNELLIPHTGLTFYTDPVLERLFNEVIPDVTIYVNRMPIFIEIVVTNPISNLKHQKYSARNATVIVINLDKEDRNLEYDELEKLVLYDESNRRILRYHDLQHKEYRSDYNKWSVWAIIGAITLFVSRFLYKSYFQKRHSGKKYR